MQRHLTAIALVTLLGTGIASAQTTTTGPPPAPDAKSSEKSGGQEAVTRPNTPTAPTPPKPATANAARASAKFEEGANSFTEVSAQAPGGRRLQRGPGLKKDGKGIWHASR